MTSRSRRSVALRHAATVLTPKLARMAAEIAVIPAPTGDEVARANFVAELLRARDLDVEVDPNGNVYANWGSRSGPYVVLAAHTDTVFPIDTQVHVTEDGARLLGPGVGDNSLGVAAMVLLVDLLQQVELVPEVGVRLVATVGEEGLGNLSGARAAVARFGSDIGAFIAVEGHNLGRITCTGVGSTRWRVSVEGPGGHSWGAYGRPSAIHGLARVVAAMSELEPPSNPKTTFNVGIIQGGISVNTIAPHASALVDIRSADEGALTRFADRVRGTILNTHLDGLSVSIETLGERPAGSTARTDPLVVAAASALREVGIEPTYDASSTDANIAMSRGIPAICIGISRGGNGHTIDEYIDVAPMADGLAQLALVVMAAGTSLARATR